MEVSRELRADRVSKKKGTAPIRLIFCWDNLRWRMQPGEACRPADWNEKQGKVKDKPGAYADAINTILDRWTRAGIDAHQDAKRALERWGIERMEAEVRVRYLRLTAEASGKVAEGELPPLPTVTVPLTFHDHYQRWNAYMRGKISTRTGRKLSTKYLDHIKNLAEHWKEFEKARKYPLTFERINKEFYDEFQSYYLTDRGYDVNTLGSAIRKLKTFLYWCEDHDLPTTPKFHRFTVPEVYRGVDFLTEAELLRWAEVDFDSPAAQAYLAQHFTPPADHKGLLGRGRPPVTLEQHRARIELARDKFLQCAYLGLRKGDAEKMAPDYIVGELVRLPANKTQGLCIIPYFDDDVFKPVELIRKYEPMALPTCLPDLPETDAYLPHIAALARITRVKVTTRVGRKTFATLKIYQGVPKSQVMLATGHQTETSFNRYLGVDEKELIEIYKRTARLKSAQGTAKAGAASGAKQGAGR